MIDDDKAKYAERYLNQRHVISMLFFILRDNCHYIEPEERKQLKHTLKAAQRQLVLIQQGDQGCFFGQQESTIEWLMSLYNQVLNSRKMAFRWYNTYHINEDQQKLLHTNRHAYETRK